MKFSKERDEQHLAYSIRFTERAQRDIDSATLRLAETSSPMLAVEWREGLYLALESLALFPRRCPIAPEKFNFEVRQTLHRRSKSTSAYRILFTLKGEGENSLDSPTVFILHIRHASSRPVTRKQAREIGSDL